MSTKLSIKLFVKLNDVKFNLISTEEERYAILCNLHNTFFSTSCYKINGHKAIKLLTENNGCVIVTIENKSHYVIISEGSLTTHDKIDFDNQAKKVDTLDTNNPVELFVKINDNEFKITTNPNKVNKIVQALEMGCFFSETERIFNFGLGYREAKMRRLLDRNNLPVEFNIGDKIDFVVLLDNMFVSTIQKDAFEIGVNNFKKFNNPNIVTIGRIGEKIGERIGERIKQVTLPPPNKLKFDNKIK